MIIREACEGDIPQVLELIHEFQKESLDSYSLFCNDDKAVKLMQSVWQNALVMVDTRIVGVIAGMIGASMVSTEPIMQELIWFVHKDYRGHGTALLTEFERFAKSRGCKQLVMVHMGNLHRKAFERYYTKQGFKLLECQYIKCLA